MSFVSLTRIPSNQFVRPMSSHQHFMLRNREFGLATQLFFDCVDNMVGHEGLTIVLADMPVGDKTGFTAQVARELPAEIVLNDDRVTSLVENMGKGIAVEWHQPTNLKLICRDALLSQNLTGFLDDSVGRSPADQGDVRLAWSLQFGRRNCRGNASHLPHAFFHHSPAL